MSQDAADFKSLPLDELWRHASWKARQIGYDRAAADLASGGSLPPLDDLRLAATDANAISLDSGIKMLIAACHAVPPHDAQTGRSIRQSVARPLAEKGLGASKPAAKQNALEALLVLVEVGDPDGVVEDVLPMLSARAPKLVAAAAAALARIFGDFGAPVADPRPVLQALPALFTNADRAVRAAAADLAAALYRWMGEAVLMQALGSLKPVQLTELKAQFVKVDMSAPAARLTRSQAAAAEAAAAAETQGVAGSEMDVVPADAEYGPAAAGPAPGAGLDPWDLATPEDVVSQIGQDFWTGLESAKWKERHEALAPLLHRLEKVARLDPASDYNRLVGEMVRIVGKDLNQLCATEAVQILTRLAVGLRKAFQAHASRVLEVVIERFKEKKQTSVDTVAGNIDALFFQVLGARLQPVLEPILRIGMVHKTPNVKLESTRYLAHLLRETPVAPTLQEIGEISPLAVKLMGDSTDPVRAAAASVLAALVKIAGQANVGRALDSLDEHKRKRVMETVETTTVKAQGAQRPQGAQGAQGARATQRPQGAPGPQRRAPGALGAHGPPQQAPNHGVRTGLSHAPPPQARPATGMRSQLPGDQNPLPPPRQAYGGRLNPAHSSAGAVNGPPTARAPRPPQPQQPQYGAPATPASSRGQRPQHTPRPGAGDFSHMSISSPSPSHSSAQHDSSGRPSVSSTPKVVKRSLAVTEFTPARGVDPHRRRLHSPSKPSDATEDMDDGLSADQARSARLKAELDLERKMRHDLEAKLARAQVEHEREARRLSERIASLQVELQSAREEFALELQQSRRSAIDADDVRGRLNTLNLDEQALRAPRTRDSPDAARPAQAPGSRPHSVFGLPTQRTRLVPIANTDTRTTVAAAGAAAGERDRTGSEAWERAVTMTHDIRERVERLKARRQPELP